MNEREPEVTIMPPDGESLPPQPPLEERNWAMACHLSGLLGYMFPFGHIFAPLAIWLFKGEKYPLVAHQGKEALNFQITVTLYLLVSALLALAVIGFILGAIVLVFHFILVIVASVKVKEGERYRYPFTIRFIK